MTLILCEDLTYHSWGLGALFLGLKFAVKAKFAAFDQFYGRFHHPEGGIYQTPSPEGAYNRRGRRGEAEGRGPPAALDHPKGRILPPAAERAARGRRRN